MAQKEFTTYRTHHGPIVRQADGKWVSVRLMEEPLKALIQSYSRTKARTLAEYKKMMELHTNSSNNTLYADADGNIAYFHANFIPKRDPKFDWTKPVDGSESGDRVERRAVVRRIRRTSSIRRTAGSTTRTTSRGRRRAPATARAEGAIRRMSIPAARTRAASTRSRS